MQRSESGMYKKRRRRTHTHTSASGNVAEAAAFYPPGLCAAMLTGCRRQFQDDGLLLLGHAGIQAHRINAVEEPNCASRKRIRLVSDFEESEVEKNAWFSLGSLLSIVGGDMFEEAGHATGPGALVIEPCGKTSEKFGRTRKQDVFRKDLAVS